MADRFWTSPIAANWDDNALGLTPWGTSSGSNDNAANPVNGDRVFFDANSTATLSAGPGSAVSLALLDMTNSPNALTSLVNVTIAAAGTLICTSTTTFDGAFAASGGSSGVFGDTSQFTGAAGAGVAMAFNDSSGSGAGASYAGSNILVFNGSSTNSSSSFSGTGHSLTFADASANLTALAVTGNVVFTGTSANVAGINVTGTVTISGTGVVFSSSVTATAFAVTGTVVGAGAMVGPVAVTTGGACQVSVTGNVTITGGGLCNSAVTGNVSVSGASSLFSGAASGTCTLSSGGGNTGLVGTLIAPYTTGAAKWGSFGALNITGFKTPGVGGMPL